MLRRILRSLITFAAIIVVYQAYVLLAVPWMEPPLAVRKLSSASQAEKDRAAQSVSKYQTLLASYFPAEHWSQTRPPKVLASSDEKAMLVLDDWKRLPEGRIEIERFAMLMFPTPPSEGDIPPRDAIILEASQKSSLQFDVFEPEKGKVGRIISGDFPGRIIIRSDMREPGPQDDLLVETADIKMNSKLMYTASPVRFRMGKNVGGGQELEIRFLVDEHARPKESGLSIAGIDSLELRRDVRMRLFLETTGLLPGKEKKDKKDRSAQNSADTGQSQAPEPPVEITCSGPFHFDFVRYVASFDRDVELRQVNPSGPSDQLSAQQLDIHFAPRQAAGAAADPLIVDPAKRQQHDIGRLEPATIVAQGHPVVAVSPSSKAEARGGKLQLGLRDRRVILSGGSDVMLALEANVLRAPTIDYQHPAPDAGTKIGHFRAAGPGSLDYAIDPMKAPSPNPSPEYRGGEQQTFRATWQKSVVLDRHEGQPLLTLEGRPQLGVANMGALAADRIQVFVREVDGTDGAVGGMTLPGAAGLRGKIQVVPERLTATGGVKIESAQLTGLTDELLVNFQSEPAATASGAGVSDNGTPSAPATTGAASAGGLFAQLRPAAEGGPPQQAYHIDSDRLRIEVAIRGAQMAPTDLVCDGNVLFREIPLVATSEAPLEVRGGQLTADQLDTDMHITIRGRAAAATEGPQAAQVSARGMTVLAEVIQLNQRENRLWIDGPGKANLVVSRDLMTGRETTSSFPLDISWLGGLNFDGRMIVLDRGVLAQGADDWLRCEKLTARLTAPIQFGETIDQATIDLAEVLCQGQVELDHQSRDEQGLASHERLQLEQLALNQQTGAINGTGPGTVQSTRFGMSLESRVQSPEPENSGARPSTLNSQPSTLNPRLHYLRIDFQRGLVGNLDQRHLSFIERVRTVYGPVDSWEQQLDGGRPEALPPEGIAMNCEKLWVSEEPNHVPATANPSERTSRPVGKIKLRAEGNVRIDGQTTGQGPFRAEADVASYDQTKDVFYLKGNPLTPARVWPSRGGTNNSAPISAQTIDYNRATGEPSATGIPYLEYASPPSPQSARGPTPTPR